MISIEDLLVEENVSLDDKEFGKIISMARKGLKADLKFSLKWLSIANPNLANMFSKVLEKGRISGSRIFKNFYNKTISNNDIDIFIDDPNLFSNFFGVIQTSYKKEDFKYRNKDDKKSKWGLDYPAGNFLADIFFSVGNSKENNIHLDIVLVESVQDLTSKFDFQVCDWYYSWLSDEIEISDGAIELLKKYEIDYTPYYKDKARRILTAVSMDQNAAASKTLFVTSMTQRLQKYIGLKGFVPTESMKEFLRELNKVEKIWSI